MFKKRILLSLATMVVLVVSIGSCVSVIVDGPRDSWAGVVEHIRPATVQIIIGDVNPVTEEPFILGSGSGFVISEDGLIATAAHVVDDLDTLYKPWIEVRFFNGETYEAKWARGARDHDVGIIKIDAHNLPILEFENRPIVEGSPILAMGSNQLSTWAVTDGIISKVEAQYESKLGHGWLQMTTTVNPSYSGGPVVNSKGKVVGIIVGDYTYVNETYVAAMGPVATDVIQGLLSSKNKGKTNIDSNRIYITF